MSDYSKNRGYLTIPTKLVEEFFSSESDKADRKIFALCLNEYPWASNWTFENNENLIVCFESIRDMEENWTKEPAINL